LKSRYNYKLKVRILCISLSGIATGFCLSRGWWWEGGICVLVTALFVRHLGLFQERSIKDMKRLINSIRLSEFNISFKSFEKKGLAPELIPEMENSISKFNEKLRKMESEQHFFDALLNRIDFGLLVMNSQNQVVWINKAALDVFGKPQPKILSDLEKVSKGLPEILNHLIPHETKIIEIIGNKKTHRMAATSIYFYTEGKSLKIISLKNIEIVLEVNESDAWKKLISVLTHEIMNSLTPIISLSDTFSEQHIDKPEMMAEAMQAIHRRSSGLINFVSNYKRLTQIPEPVKTRFAATEWMENIYNLLAAAGFQFKYDIEPENIEINADRAMMEQVMINLIKNACESSSSDIPPDVRVHIGKDACQRPLIRVSDTGKGILPEVMDKIFVPFFTTKSGGSGIGLSICRQIINLHRGAISVRSKPEKGTCFTIIL
jgi:nitrogen fixation/metabolism regulation signal transduction histidine kinase